MEWVRFVLGALFLLAGLFIFTIQIIGVFKMKYVLNRMHAAAMGDTLGISASLIGLMFLNGFNLLTLKLFLVILFFWISSPVSSHLLAQLEVATNEDEEPHYLDETSDKSNHEGGKIS